MTTRMDLIRLQSDVDDVCEGQDIHDVLDALWHWAVENGKEPEAEELSDLLHRWNVRSAKKAGTL